MAGDEITEKTDLINHNYGFGLLWRVSSNVRLQAFYELVKNETTTGIAVNGNADYSKNIADNVFTLRLQYKF
jgi:phosphate-selective porin